MANEITLNVQTKLANGKLADQYQSGNLNVNQATQLADTRVIAAATADTAYTFADVTTFGYMLMQNLDPTNYVAVGPTSGGAIVNFLKLKPGELALFRIYPGISFRMQANTGVCNVLVKLWND